MLDLPFSVQAKTLLIAPNQSLNSLGLDMPLFSLLSINKLLPFLCTVKASLR